MRVKMKKYKIKPTKKQLELMKLYWGMFKAEEAIFWSRVGELERKLSTETKIKDIEFFYSDNECVGIGDYNREMKLIHRGELE
jgi:hypothetical protein